MDLNRAELTFIRSALRDYHLKVRRGDIDFDEEEDRDCELEQVNYQVQELREKIVSEIKEIDRNGT